MTHVECPIALTTEQLAFLRNLSRSPMAAAHNVDASVVGPLIRANLVRWDDDSHAAARRHLTPPSTFTLTHSGAQALADQSIEASAADG